MAVITDPISDFITRLRNASAVRKTALNIPYSRLKFEMAKILVADGWIIGVEKVDDGFGHLRITLKYDENGQPALSHLARISKPGQRVYASRRDLPRVKNDLGMAIISTSQGLMTNHDARRRRLGGEVLCEIA